MKEIRTFFIAESDPIFRFNADICLASLQRSGTLPAAKQSGQEVVYCGFTERLKALIRIIKLTAIIINFFCLTKK